MHLEQTTKKELEILAKKMLIEKQDTAQYQSFGILVRQGSKDFKSFENNICFGQVTVEGESFLYFCN